MKKFKYCLMTALVACSLGMMTGCSDEPDASNYYTFTGEMMSEYLKNHSEFSEFTAIVERAEMMDLLSAYGHYTCFAPTNEAFERYYQKRGIRSIDDLTDADCDTIARTHLVGNMYATSEMNDGVLTTANMNRRYIEVSHDLDSDSNAVVFLNRSAHIIFTMQDDSVENGIMQPVTEVLESSNRMLPDVMRSNPRISLFFSALVATGLVDSLYKYRDDNYNAKDYPRYKYTSHVNKETATAPDEKKYGFTAFVPTDSVLNTLYGITNLEQLYQKACEIYDATYPEDASSEAHDYANLTDRRNPLNRFVAYHILERDVKGWNYLTPLNDIGIITTLMNPVDWYETMLPHTMMKFERLTVRKFAGTSTVGQRYINRRYDDDYQILGTQVQRSIEKEYTQDALNGRYFYIDDIVAFSETTRDIVDNCRIRMDFSTIFPELMTNDIRQNGNPKYQDPDYDETAKYGRNYYFPDGYLKNVKCAGYFIYRRPHDYYDCYEGDEMNLFGNYDITFKIPPVPYEGEWQVRMGYAQEPTRGIAQVYFDGKPQGIPLDMTIALNDASILGSSWVSDYTSMTTTQLSEDQKTLKNKGYYRGAAGGYRYNGAGGTTTTVFATQTQTFRIVLCTVHMDPNQDHFLRIRSVSSKMGNDNEFMLDYLELVPKSIYGVTDEGQIEDML
ncbi:MAG: fasciclin domain-containing protein [Prevotella sp.]|nr:fasciclin domain-containing protein [Prevotella sp.]